MGKGYTARALPGLSRIVSAWPGIRAYAATAAIVMGALFLTLTIVGPYQLGLMAAALVIFSAFHYARDIIRNYMRSTAMRRGFGKPRA